MLSATFFKMNMPNIFSILFVLFLGFFNSSAIAEWDLRCPDDQDWTDDTVALAIGLSLERLDILKRERALDNEALCTMPKKALERALWRVDHPKPGYPGEWARFRAAQQKDEHGVVKKNGLHEALATRRAMMARMGRQNLPSLGGTKSQNTQGSALQPGLAGISAGGWQSLGPGNVGGRIRSILIHPTSPNTMWVGSVGGGIWQTVDGGSNWNPVNDFMGNLAVSSLVMSPTNSNVMYASTGEGFYNADAIPGAGVFKSTDGGVNWAALSATNPANNSGWNFITRLAIHPTNGNTLLASAQSGDSTEGYIFRTTDGGATWTTTSTGWFVGDVKFDPLNGNNALYAPGFYGGTLRYSRDAGATWANSNLSPAGRTEIAYSKTIGKIYASVDANNGQVYSSVDGGATWTLKSTPGHLGSQGWYDNAIWVDPSNSNHVIVGGIDLYRSTDGGVSFTKISLWYDPASVHADHHAIVSHPNYDGINNKTVYFGNDGGIYKAQDISRATQTTGWTKLNNGLAITQFYSGAGHTGTNGRIIGGTQDNGSLVYAGTGTNWTASYGGDGGYSAIDPNDGNYVYGEYVYLQLHRASNGVNSYDISNGISDAGSYSTANFIAPFALDPNVPTTMYAGGQSLWRSLNVKNTAPSWSRIYNGAGTGTNISAIAVAQGNSAVVWIGKNNGNLFKTSTGLSSQPTWAGVYGPPARMVLSILIDKDNSNIVYVATGGYSNQNLWRTNDGGNTWTNIGAGLPASPIRTIQRHPANGALLYVGTEVGVFTSENTGATWSTTNDGPSNVSVEQLFWLNANTLVAATHGRGMFKTTVNASTASYALTITKAGLGSGTVTSSPTGIACGTTCNANFTSGTSVTLTPVATSGATFAGWSGACTGTGGCTVSMTAARSVTATFNTATASYALAITKAGSGSGTVTSSPTGIACGTTCSADFTSGTKVTLKPVATSGATFAGWSGACTGTGGCMVSMTAARSVTATFNAVTASYALTITKAGTGRGTVTSSPTGISCGSTCSANFTSGTSVTLTPVATSGATFAGWSGACTGTGGCTVSMTAARTVTATFNTAISLGAALENTNLSWTSSGNVLWSSQTSVSSDGVDAAQSGAISNNQVSSLETQVVGPGTLSFFWKVSSELGYDFLTFYYDGYAQQGAISGASDWSKQEWTIPAGTHSLRWTYQKDYSSASGLDRAWLDQVSYTRSAVPQKALMSPNTNKPVMTLNQKEKPN